MVDGVRGVGDGGVSVASSRGRDRFIVPMWLGAMLRRRPASVLLTSVGVAISVALLASVGAFVASSKDDMTHRAVSTVSVDWQVEVRPGAAPAHARAVVERTPSVVAVQS